MNTIPQKHRRSTLRNDSIGRCSRVQYTCLWYAPQFATDLGVRFLGVLCGLQLLAEDFCADLRSAECEGGCDKKIILSYIAYVHGCSFHAILLAPLIVRQRILQAATYDSQSVNW